MNANKKLNAIIIDDEKDAIEVLEDLIQVHCPEVRVIGTAHSSKAGLRLLESQEPDLLFLDIQMPGQDGFDFLTKTNYSNFHTIFVSAYQDYAIKAFKYHAVAYLLKPVGVQELKEALESLEEKKRNSITANYQELLRNLEEASSKRIAISTGGGYRYFEVDEIIRVEAAKNYSNVYTSASTSPILVSKNLKQFENILTKYDFLRVHNSHLVNPKHIGEYLRKDGGSIVLSDHKQIFFGPNYRQLVIDALSRNAENI